MENFYIGHSKTIEFTTSDYHYDSGWIDGNVLHDGCTRLPLPFSVLYFRNMQYDYLLISTERVFYRINKCRLEIEDVGALHDSILAVGSSCDNIVIVTEREIFAFNAYFDLTKSKAHGIPFSSGGCSDGAAAEAGVQRGGMLSTESASGGGRRKAPICEFVWADDIFCLLTRDGSFVFNLNLELLNSLGQCISSAVFISRYNKFACVVGNIIKFIEPNGLEHGDPLAVDCDSVELLRVDDAELLLAISSQKIEVFYMKNFHWYRKMVIPRTFLCCEHNRVVLQQGCSVTLLHLYKEMGSGFVVDGCALKYTNLSASLIPPPYFYKEIVFRSQVDSYASTAKLLYVLAARQLYRYRIDRDCFYQEDVFDVELPGVVNEMIVVEGQLLLRCGSSIYEFDGVGLSHLIRFGDVEVAGLCSAAGLLGILFTDGSFGRINMKGCCASCMSKENSVNPVTFLDGGEGGRSRADGNYPGDGDSNVVCNSTLHHICENSSAPDDTCPCSLRILHKFRLNIRSSYKLGILLDGNLSACRGCALESGRAGEELPDMQRGGMSDMKQGGPSDAEKCCLGGIQKICLLNDNVLQIADKSRANNGTNAHMAACPHTAPVSDVPGRGSIDDVSSFLLYRQYLIYVRKDKLVIREDDVVCGEVYADRGQSLLAVHDNRIISQTRFGSLETTTSRVFSSALAREHIAARRYREAASVCDRNHIGYEIFYDNGRCPAVLIDVLDDRQILSLVGVMRVAGPLPHENDSLERLRRAFRVEEIYKGYKQSVDGSDSNSSAVFDNNFIRDDSVGCLFDTPYHNPLFVLGDFPKPLDAPDEDASIDLSNTAASVNRILRRLTPDKHINTIIGLFIQIGRTDLCFYLPDLQKVTKILVGLVSTSDIIRAATTTLSLDKIAVAYKACQSDVLPFTAFYNSRANLEYSLYDYLENRETALYYLVREANGSLKGSRGGLNEYCDDIPQNRQIGLGDVWGSIIKYVEKYSLFDQLLMYQHRKVFDINFYPYVARHTSPERAFVLYLLGGDREMALEIAYRNVLWREALREFTEAEVRIRFIDLLVVNRRYSEAGEVYDEYLGDYERAIEFYMRGDCYEGAAGAWRKLQCMELGQLSIEGRCRGVSADEHSSGSAAAARPQSGAGAMLLGLSKAALRNEVARLGHLGTSFNKYKERIAQVRLRLSENLELSQTSYSYSSLRTVRNALLRDRPGGVYEHEYVLNKLREIVLGIIEWRDRTEHLLEIFDMLGICECRNVHAQAFASMGRELRSEVEALWSFKRHDYDQNRPVVEKPSLTAYFE